MEYIKDFQEIRKNDKSLIGGKAYSIGVLSKMDKIRMPPGFVILSTVFEELVRKIELEKEINALANIINCKEIEKINNISKKIELKIINSKIPKNIYMEIERSLNKFNFHHMAVRSSGTLEDSQTAAWAGQLESYLNTTKENLLKNIKKCWTSLYSPRAIFYQRNKGLNKQKKSIAVIVQKMIKSEKSGVSFSVNPITNNKNEIIIDAGLGLGEAIVSGKVSPDNYVIEKKSQQIINKSIKNQKQMLSFSQEGKIEWKDLSQEFSEKQVLSDKEILALSGAIIYIENQIGFPCDVEWAIEKENIYILQARPITTLK